MLSLPVCLFVGVYGRDSSHSPVYMFSREIHVNKIASMIQTDIANIMPHVQKLHKKKSCILLNAIDFH